MTKARSFIYIIFCLAAGVIMTGCALRAQQLNAFPLNHDISVDTAMQTDKKILLYALEDLRGGTFGGAMATTFIPVVNLFHAGHYREYAEYSAMLFSRAGGFGGTITVGSMPESYPYLMAAMIREMRLTANATPVSQINTKVDLRSYDYVVTGKLKKTEFTVHFNIIPLGILGILGVPFVFINYEMDYELSFYRADNMNTAIGTKAYTYSGTKVAGQYYGQEACFDHFIGSLEKSMQQGVLDLATAISQDKK